MGVPRKYTGKNMTEKKARFMVDWFRMSFDGGLGNATVMQHLRVLGFRQENMIAAGRFYNRAVQLVPCGRLDWHTENTKQGMLLTLTGNDLAIIRQHAKLTVDGVIAGLLTVPGGKTTRIDFAWDVQGFDADPDDIFQAWLDGRLTTHAKKVTRLVENDRNGDTKGKTVYVGSRTSQQMMRAYDKALEQGDGEGDWLRVEMEIKGALAHNAAKAECKYGPVQTTLESVRRFVKLEGVEWWGVFMTGTLECTIETNPRKETSGKDWLHKVALQKVIEAAREGDAVVIRALKSLHINT